MNSKILPLGRLITKGFSDSFRFIANIRNCSYRSSISLDKLHPTSSLKLTTPEFSVQVPEDPNERFNGYIPIKKLDIVYSTSSGPGGQNVNNVKTKVDLRFNVYKADWLEESLRDKLIKENFNKITKEGFLVFKSDLTRSQHLNLADCMRKLRNLLRKAAEPEPQISVETIEMLRRRREKASRQRLQMKRHNSQIRRMKTDL